MADEQQGNANNEQKDSSDNASTGSANNPGSNANQSTISTHTNNGQNSYAHPYITVNPQQNERGEIAESKEANRLTKIGLCVNGFLLLGTLVALTFAWQSNKISKQQITANDSTTRQSIIVFQQSADAATKSAKTAENNYNLSKELADSNFKISKQLNTATYDAAVAANKSAQIADKSLIETKKSYDFSRESATKEIRAYLAITSIRAINFIKDSTIAIEAKVINVGKTPAYKYRCTVFFKLFMSPNSVNIDSVKNIKGNVAEITLGSSQSTDHTAYGAGPLSEQDINITKSGIFKLYAVVSISYYDIFNVLHSTNGFFEYSFDKKGFSLCLNHNNAD